MAGKVVAIVGSYRKGGSVDQAVDAILAGAREKGAETKKLYLIDYQIEFCTNCRACTQVPGTTRGKCVHQDDFETVLASVEVADVLVLGSPVNFGNATAIFRRFMERLVSTAYWPWNALRGPKPRNTNLTKHAVIVSASAAPALFIRLFPGTLQALRTTAKALGARPIATLCIGLAGKHPEARISASVLKRARSIGLGLCQGSA
jgi:NAD(P)H-dependent FMN reductase